MVSAKHFLDDARKKLQTGGYRDQNRKLNRKLNDSVESSVEIEE